MSALREVIAFFGLDHDKNSFREVDAKVERLRGSIVGLARVFTTGLIANEFRNMITQTAALGDQTAKASQRLGIGTAALQELRHAAKLSGVEAGALDQSLQYLAKNAADAANGTGEAKEAFARLGVQMRDGNGQVRSADELFGDVAEGLSRVQSQTERVGIAMRIFGRSGALLLPMLKDGKTGLAEMRQEAEALGVVMSDALLESSEEYSDTMDRLQGVIQGVKNLITEGLLPGIIDAGKGTLEWVKANRELISRWAVGGLKYLGEILGSVKDAVVGIAGAMWDLLGTLGPVAQGLGAVAAIAGALFLLFGAKGVVLIFFLGLLREFVALVKGERNLFTELSDMFIAWQDYFAKEPVKADDHWMVQIAKHSARWFTAARDALAEIIGMLAYDSDTALGDLMGQALGISNGGPRGRAWIRNAQVAAETAGSMLGVYRHEGGHTALGTASDFWFGDAASQMSSAINAPVDNRSAIFGSPPVREFRTEVNVTQTINPAPGMDEAALGRAAADAAAEQLETTIEQAVRSSGPGRRTEE